MPGKGTMFAKKKVEKWVQTDIRNTKYCLTMDIEKFYPSVNLGVLKNMLRRKISKKAMATVHQALSFISRLGWLRHCNSYNFYQGGNTQCEQKTAERGQ